MSVSRIRALLRVSIVLAGVLLAQSAHAAEALVLVVRPALGEAGAEAIVSHAHGELVADGFDVEVLASVPAARRAALLKDEGARRGAEVSIGLFVSETAWQVELWFLDLATQRLVVQTVDAQLEGSGREPQILARRLVDQVRARLLRPIIESRRPLAPQLASRAPSGQERAREKPQAARVTFGVEAGAAVLASLRGLSAAVLPVVRAQLTLSQRLSLRAGGAWFGTDAEVRVAGARADVEQGLVLLEAVLSPWGRARIQPRFSLGTGGLFVGVNGEAQEPAQGRSSRRWVLAADAGAGLRVALGSQLALCVEAHVVLSAPAVAVRFQQLEAARVGRPSTLVALTLAWGG